MNDCVLYEASRLRALVHLLPRDWKGPLGKAVHECIDV
jgi:hypothetical protein